MTGAAIARGLVGYDGRLMEADAQLDDLNARAGGRIGAPLAVPQVATLARLAGRLGILISRNVLAADGDDDIELWVRAAPEDRGVSLAVTGWRRRAAWKPKHSPTRDRDFARSEAGWSWETDAALRITSLALEAAARDGLEAAMALGQPLTQLFVLDDSTARAFSAQAALDDGAVVSRSTGDAFRLTATVRHDRAGRFAGYVGSARRVAKDDDARPTDPGGPGSTPAPILFGQRLDRALRGPLGRIIANADSINAQVDGPLAPDYAGYAADIAHAGRHLLGLIDDLVDLAAIERPDFAVASDRIDLADLARRAAGLLQLRANERGIAIHRPDDRDSVPARGEFRRVLQILVNLLGNAVRYSPDGAVVTIDVTSGSPLASISVTDHGKGVAPDDQARIFEKFERVDPGEPGGSGLGLYIARRLARAMGGDLDVESAPGEGARFTVQLPAA